MSAVDYSKWDKMANEMSDSDDDHGNNPEVTTFDEPQSVTFGGTPASAEVWTDTSDTGHHPTPSSPHVEAPIDGFAGAAAEAGGTASAASPRPKIHEPVSNEQLAENGAAVHRDDNDGRQVLHYVWRQAREEVAVVVPVPSGTRAADVEVSLTAKPETVTEGVADLLRVSVKASSGVGIASGAAGDDVAAPGVGAGMLHVLEGELAFQVKLGEEGEGEVDWELKDYPGTVVTRDCPVDGEDAGGTPAAATAAAAGSGEGFIARRSGSNGDRRGVEVVLRKHCPVSNAAVWWKSLLKGGPEIDVSAIKGRATNEHQSVWEEALGMFKEKVASRKSQEKISVDMGGGD